MLRRKGLGSCSVYTPRSLADAIVDWLANARVTSRWLEPSVGTGVFLESLASRGVRARDVVAVDLSRRSQPNDKLASVVRGIDFLEWARTTTDRFDCIVGNPPYAPIKFLGESLR